jgi:hypothetical protein
MCAIASWRVTLKNVVGSEWQVISCQALLACCYAVSPVKCEKRRPLRTERSKRPAASSRRSSSKSPREVRTGIRYPWRVLPGEWCGSNLLFLTCRNQVSCTPILCTRPARTGGSSSCNRPQRHTRKRHVPGRRDSLIRSRTQSGLRYESVSPVYSVHRLRRGDRILHVVLGEVTRERRRGEYDCVHIIGGT